MNWKGILGLAASCLVAGLVVGLVLGLRGCGGGANKLLQENAELKAEVTRYRYLASEASKARAEHAEARHDAERALAASQEAEAASADTVRRLRDRVAKAGRKRDERDDLIDALSAQNAVKDDQIDWITAALEASKQETSFSMEAEQATNRALVASETRGDKLERYVVKSKRRLIWSNVGSVLGTSLVFTAAAVATR